MLPAAIDWEKYGARKSGREDGRQQILQDLPKNIYCDLVTTLNDKCLEVQCVVCSVHTVCSVQYALCSLQIRV